MIAHYDGQSFSYFRVVIKNMTKGKDYAEKKLLRFLSFRMRSRQEVVDYLRRNKIDEGFINLLVEKYQRLGYIDDDAFTKAWINDRIKLKAYSKRMIAYELRNKGIDNGTIEKYIKAADDAQYECAIRNLKKRYKGMDIDNKKMISFLLRKGFEYNIALKAVNDFCQKKGEV